MSDTPTQNPYLIQTNPVENTTVQFFKDSVQVGCFDFGVSPVTFTGDVDESARIFVDYVISKVQTELTALTEQRDQYKADLQSADNHNHEIATKLEIVTEQRDSIDSMYHKVIKEVLECDPIPACQREDDQLESPWEVIARIREQRDRLAEALERIADYQGRFAEDDPQSIAAEALQAINQNQPALPTASATPLHP